MVESMGMSSKVRGLMMVAVALAAMKPLSADAGVIIVSELPLMHQTRTLSYQGVRAREELDDGAVSLILPDENRIVELHPKARSFEEKPLSAALGELSRVQRAIATEVRLLDESLKVRKGGEDTIAGLDCTHYRFDWQAHVATDHGKRNYRIQSDQCISTAPAALEARKAVMRHMRAIAGRFGEVLRPEDGEMWLFDTGRMFFGVSARKLIKEQVRIGGFPVFDETEIDFGGMLMEPVIRGVARQRAGRGNEASDKASADAEVRRMEKALARIQSPEFQAEMREAMRQLQDPKVQAELRQFMQPGQMQAMQQTMQDMAEGKGPVASMSEGKLRIISRVTSLKVTEIEASRLSPPVDYVWKAPEFSTPETQEPDTHDGDGALSRSRIERLLQEARTGAPPKGADRHYAPVPREAGPWMHFYREWEGVPYRWGGTSKLGVDCSGLTQNAYRAVPHISIPRTTAEQIRAGQRVSLSNARPGDLIFFDTGYRHVGVWIGQNKFFHASSSKGVTLSSLASSYWTRAFREVRRISQ